MENDNKFNNNLNNTGSENKTLNRFGISSSNDINNVKSRINETKARNLNRNVNHDNPTTSGVSSSLGEKDGLEKKDKKKDNVNSSVKDSNNSTTNTGKGNPLKSIGSALGNTALSAASQKSEVVNKSVKAVNTMKTSAKIIKALAAFFSTPVGWGVLGLLIIPILVVFIIIIIGMVISSLGMKFGFTGNETYDQFNEYYQEGMSKEELDKIVSDNDKNLGTCELGLFTNIKNFFGVVDLSNNCEFSHYVKKIINDKEKSSNISTISPGYFLSALFYAYDTQNVDENGKLYIKPESNSDDEEEADSMNDLDVITALMAVKHYDKNDLNLLLNNYVLRYTHSYYTYDKVINDDGTESYVCNDHGVDSSMVSEDKFNIFLRYGEDVSSEYQRDMSRLNAYNKTDSECYGNLGYSKPDTSKYEAKADTQSLEDDNAYVTISSGTYHYNKGFIYTTYPRYDTRYIVGGVQEYNYNTDKEIEQIIENIASRQDYVNYILGYPSSVKTNIISSGAVCTYNIDGIDVTGLKVRLMHAPNNAAVPEELAGKPIEGQELIDFDKYILGVVYAEDGGAPVEAMKAQAIAAASYAIKLASGKLVKEGGNTILEISNSTFNQTYCDPERGCYICTSPVNSTISSVYTNGTVPEGAICREWKIPLNQNSSIRDAARSVNGMILVNVNNKPVSGNYTSTTQIEWNRLANEGLDYVEILKKSYPDAYILTSACTYGATGEWAKWRQYSKEWGGLLVGSNTLSKVGCFITSYSMIIAKSSPQIMVSDFNPGTFLGVIKQNSCLSGDNLISNCAIRAAVGEGVSFTNQGMDISGMSYSDKVGIISQYISQGYDVMLRVKSPASARKYNENSDQHWVVVTGINGTDILMADPASDETVVLDKYHEEGIIHFQYIKFNKEG